MGRHSNDRAVCAPGWGPPSRFTRRTAPSASPAPAPWDASATGTIRAGADLIVVRADAVAEQQEHAVVVRPTREPAHEPRPALGAAQLRLAGRGILMPTSPDRRVDRLHATRAQRVATAGLRS